MWRYVYVGTVQSMEIASCNLDVAPPNSFTLSYFMKFIYLFIYIFVVLFVYYSYLAVHSFFIIIQCITILVWYIAFS